MSACEILSLYSDINNRCIEHGKALKRPKSREFVDLTRIMDEVKVIFKAFKVTMKPSPSMDS
jgi:hypothetical protein